MRIIFLLLISLLFSSLSFANEAQLKEKMDKLKILQDKVAKECIGNSNSGSFSVEVDGKTFTCPQLIVITDRLKKQLDEEVAKFKEECEAKNQEEAKHAALAVEAANIAEKSAECTPSPDRNKCFGQYACNALAATGPIVVALNAFSRVSGNQSLQQCTSAGTGCVTNVLKGIFDSIWSSLTMIWDIGKWAVKKVGQLFGMAKESEAKTSERAMMAQQASPSFLQQLKSNPVDTLKKMAKDLYDSIKDAAINHYGCEKWSGVPFGSTCLQPMTTWDCGTCQQKAQVFCGIAGFAVGEIGTAFLTGGIVSGGKIALKGAIKLGSAPTRTVARFMGKTFPKSAVKVSKAAGTVKTLASVGLSATQRRLISGWHAVSNSRISNTIGGLASTLSKSVVGTAASIALKPITVYLRAMDRAFVAGMNVVDNGAKAVSKKFIREEAVRGAKIAEEALGVSADASNASKVANSVPESTVAKTASSSSEASATRNASTSAQKTEPSSGIVIEASSANKTAKVTKQNFSGSSAKVPKKGSTSSAKSSGKKGNSSAKAADNTDELADIAKYRQDPEYMDLFKGPQMYDDHHKELAMVIRAMEETQPAMTKAAIRKKIQETLNSCQL